MISLWKRCTSKNDEKTTLLDIDRAQHVGGEKDIGLVGGISLLINNITGPGLITMPLVYQDAGWFVPTVTMLAIMILSSFASTMLCQAMTKIPGNSSFEGRVEFSGLTKHIFPRWAFLLSTLLLIVSLMAALITSIVISAQTMDLALIAIFKKTFALEFYKDFGFVELSHAANAVSPFGKSFVLSLGFLIVLALTVPLGYFNLDDNIVVQKGAMIMLFLIFVEWFANFFTVGMHVDRVPMFGKNQSQVLGNVIFNYAFVVTIPSWINEKRKDVSVNRSIWSATAIATTIYISIGAWAYHFDPDDDLLVVMNSGSTGVMHVMAQISVYLFPIVALLSSIPVFSIIIKYNLLENKICKKRMANFWAVIFPWILSIAFYTGNGLFDVINWASLLVNGVVNFIVPFLLFIMANRESYPSTALLRSTHRIATSISEHPHDTNIEEFHPLPRKSLLAPSTWAIGFSVVLAVLLTVTIGYDVYALIIGNNQV